MSKRRRIAEISIDMFKIINQKPTLEEIEKLAEILNEKEKDFDNEKNDIFPVRKIAISEVNNRSVDGN